MEKNVEIIHVLKTDQDPFTGIAMGQKTCEFRKNDRNFRVGDGVLLVEFSGDEKRMCGCSGYSGNWIRKRISCITKAYGIPDDFVMLSLESRHEERFFESYSARRSFDKIPPFGRFKTIHMELEDRFFKVCVEGRPDLVRRGANRRDALINLMKKLIYDGSVFGHCSHMSDDDPDNWTERFRSEL